MSEYKSLQFKMLTDSSVRTFRTHASGTKDLNAPLRIDIFEVNRRKTPKGSTSVTSSIHPSTLAKRFHRPTHANIEETERFMKAAGIMDEEMEDEIYKVSQACEVCASSGPPAPSQKVSRSHNNEELNEEIQMDYTYGTIRDTKLVVLHIVDEGTPYSETAIVTYRRVSMP